MTPHRKGEPPKSKTAPRPTLARSVGGLPLPPKPPKPPAPRVMKPLLAAPPKPSASKPRPPQPSKPASSVVARPSVAGKLGAFMPRQASGTPTKPSGKKRR